MQITTFVHQAKQSKKDRFCLQTQVQNYLSSYQYPCCQLLGIVVLALVNLVPIQAQQVFCEQVGTDNPFDFIYVGKNSNPQLVDVDGDGHLDLIVGAEDGTISYYKNNGSGSYTQQTGAANPFDAIIGASSFPGMGDPFMGHFANPQLIDLDGDGDLDLIFGEDNGGIFYYQNINGVYTEQTGIDNPFDAMNFDGPNSPQLADLDDDGDLDLVVGKSFDIEYYTNDGNNNYIPQTGAANPFDGIQILFFPDCQLIDIDGDNDLDLVAGENGGSIVYYINDGNENYTEQTGTANPFDGINVGQWASPNLADADGDGDLDLVIGEKEGNINYYKNINMLALASTANCEANSGEVEINISSSETTGIYTITGDFTASVGNAGTMGGTATIPTGITTAGTYNIVVTSNEGCEVPLEVMIDPTCAFGKLLVDIKVVLKGPHNGTDMNTTLNSTNSIPTTQPYTSVYSGTENVTNIPAEVVDWVLIELRSDANTITATRAAFLKKDGTVVDLDGISAVSFSGIPEGNYYVAVRHRNHLGVMTNAPLLLN